MLFRMVEIKELRKKKITLNFKFCPLSEIFRPLAVMEQRTSPPALIGGLIQAGEGRGLLLGR